MMLRRVRVREVTITLTTLLTVTNSFSLSRLFGIPDKIDDKSLSEVNKLSSSDVPS